MIRKEINTKEALNKLMILCSRSEKCSSDIKEKLKSWNINEEDSLKILDKLETEGYVDDLRYAKSFANDKFRFNKWGKNKIKYQLLQKNIKEEYVEQALDSIDIEEYNKILSALIIAKSNNIKAKSDYELKNKILRYCINKGFEAEKVFSYIDDLLKT